MISPSMSSCEHTLNTLRYADRVKELGASDPSRQTGERAGIEDIKIFLEGEKIFILNTISELDDFSGELIEDEDERVLSPEDSDLAQLRSLNDGECSADWYQFQESVAHLQVNILSETICRKILTVFRVSAAGGGGGGDPQELAGQHGALAAAGRLPPRHDQRGRL